MPMKPLSSRPMANLLFDEETGRTIIRVSIFVDPDDLDLESEVSDREPSIPVKVKRGRTTIFGKVDREAYRTWLRKDPPGTVPIVPMPTDGGRPSFRERMYR